jgi:hypothetical protein
MPDCLISYGRVAPKKKRATTFHTALPWLRNAKQKEKKGEEAQLIAPVQG